MRSGYSGFQLFVKATWLLGLVFFAFLLGGCATLREDVPRPVSQAFERPQETALGRAYTTVQAQHPDKSGIRVLNNGLSALMTRAALVDLAEKTIDVQYYIFDADDSGSFLLDRLLAAAERGVRVRMILDDYLIGFDDALLARINAHPNVELRLFNPFPKRERWSRSLQMLFNLDRLGRRMHNKIFVVDGQIGVMGGRNVSDLYFEGEASSNFRDIDLLVSGPAMAQAERIFDHFWNSDMVVPASAINERDHAGTAAERLAELRSGASVVSRKAAEHGGGSREEYRQRKPEYVQRILGGDGMIWAPTTAIGEPPRRKAEGAAKSSSEVARAMAIARQAAMKEATFAVAYFVPGERGVEVLGEMVARGVRVRVVTNSLASTDVVAVHAGYSRYRQALLEKGVELYEYRPDAQRPIPKNILRLGRSESALHAKIVVYDRRMVWVGSANFDPRSRHLNTEAGLLIDSPELAEKLLAGIERDFGADHSWRLLLEDEGNDRKSLVWQGERNGQMLRLPREPDVGFWRFMELNFYRLIPGLENLL